MSHEEEVRVLRIKLVIARRIAKYGHPPESKRARFRAARYRMQLYKMGAQP